MGVLLHRFLVLRDHLLQCLRVEARVELGFLLFLLGVENFVEYRFVDVEHDVAEHLNQPSIGVISETRVAGAAGESFHALVVQAEVEDRIHHARHRELRARTHAHQQRVLACAELLPLKALQRGQRFFHLAVHFFRHRVVAHVFATSLGLDGEARRNGEASVRHLGEPGAFAAENVFHLAVAIGLASAEEVHVFHRRWFRFLRFRFNDFGIRESRCCHVDPLLSIPLFRRFLAIGHDLGKIRDRGEFLDHSLQ